MKDKTLGQYRLGSKEVELLGEKYIVYIKEVPTKIENGEAKATALRAFVKKV